MMMDDINNRIQIPEDIPRTDVMTGDSDYQRFLYYQLSMSMKTARRIDIIVSFLMESANV